MTFQIFWTSRNYNNYLFMTKIMFFNQSLSYICAQIQNELYVGLIINKIF